LIKKKKRNTTAVKTELTQIELKERGNVTSIIHPILKQLNITEPGIAKLF